MSPIPGGGLAVLTYHAFSDRPSVTSITPEWFAETLDRLIEAGYHGVDLEDWVASGRPDQPQGFAIAIDDGLVSILKVADLLAERQLPATVFVVADRVGLDNAWPGQPRSVLSERLLDWSDLEALGKLGFRFGSHGSSHSPMARLSLNDQDRELRRSRETIEARLGRPCGLLAYPYGASGPELRESARRWYSAAFGTRLGYASSFHDLFEIHRIDAFYLRSRRDLDALTANRWRRELARRDVLRRVRGRANACLNFVTSRAAG